MRMVGGLVVILAACGGAPAATRPAAPLALPGECVDPAADAAVRLAEVTAPLGESPLEGPTLDLDGDGVEDRVFSAGAGVTTNTLLYVTRGGCAHFVGDVQQPPRAAPDGARHHGLVDVQVDDSVACEGAPCGCAPGELRFRFDGAAYALDAAASRPGVERPCPEP
jgi:hypothetical protein